MIKLQLINIIVININSFIPGFPSSLNLDHEMSPGLDINSFPAGFSFYLNNRFLEAVILFTVSSRECSELGSVCGLYVHKLLDNFHILKEWGAALPDSSISLEAAEDLEDFLVLEPGSRSRSHRQETSSPKSSSSTASFQVKLHI